MKKNRSVFFALLKKHFKEQSYFLRKGNFDFWGVFLKGVLFVSLAALFVVFLRKFSASYLAIATDGVQDAAKRRFELSCALCFAYFLGFSLWGASRLSKEFYLREDLFLFSAMPVKSTSLFLSGLVSSYLVLFLSSLFFAAPSFLCLAEKISAGVIARTFLVVLFLPLLSLFFGAILSLPYHALVRFLRHRYLLSLLLCTLLLAGGFFLYHKILLFVKDLLLGDELKYFFNEARMGVLTSVLKKLYPGVFFAQILEKNPYRPSLFVLMLALILFFLSLLSSKAVSGFMKKPQEVSSINYKRGLCRKRGQLFSLLKKERKEILRTPSYAFSCFSTAAVLPLMVYFCMSIGSALVKRVVGIDCSRELALFLTLIFGSLSNVFCSTNVSREGENFYCIKAMPLSAWSYFGGKILFCFAVSLFSQVLNAAVLCIFHYVTFLDALFIALCGTLFSLAQICFATKLDFSRANFCSFEEGEAKESSKVSSAVILAGTVSSFLVGGAALFLKLYFLLKFKSGANLFYASGGAVVLLFLLCFAYFAHLLSKKFARFEGGGLL